MNPATTNEGFNSWLTEERPLAIPPRQQRPSGREVVCSEQGGDLMADRDPPGCATALAERLERGEVIFYQVCPFALPAGDDMKFLLEQQLASRAHKNISYDPSTGKAAGFLRHNAAQAERLRQLLAVFAEEATNWLAATLPRYARGWQR